MRDQLDDDALAARKRGMDYGDYMAIKPRVPVPEAPKVKQRLCVICGAPLTRAKQMKYCGDECRGKAQDLRKRGRCDGDAE